MNRGKSRSFVANSLPIVILSSDAARIITHLHTVLVLAYFYFHFPALVAKPVVTLLTNLLPLTIFQSVYAMACLPINVVSSAASGKMSKSSSLRKMTRNTPSAAIRINTAIVSLLLTAFLSSPIMTVFMILFGAPLTTHLAQTYLCAAHMSLMAIFPLFYVYGLSRTAWKEIAGAMLPFDEVWGGTIGVSLGAWLGAIPIPLDWDRDWQRWPITIIAGAYLGYAIGKLSGKYILPGKRIEFD